MAVTAPAGVVADRLPRRRARSGLVLVLVVCAVLGVRTSVLEPFRVSETSMEPTLTDGSVVLVDRVSPSWTPLRRGDLVVLEVDGTLVVKRLVGLPGEVVAVRDALLFVDGLLVREPYVDAGAVNGTYFGPVTVPPDELFVLGDNRLVSVDSRAFGTVPRSDVIGRVLR